MKKTTILVLLLPLFIANLSLGQKTNTTAPGNWFNLDKAVDGYDGVSTELAYKQLLKGKKSSQVIVGVIDSGIDILHEDLQGIIWVNEDEIPENGVDDDNNGYIDDINGWNFIGGKDGTPIDQDTYELTREYVRLSSKYKGKDASDAEDAKEYQYYQEIKKEYDKKSGEINGEYAGFKPYYDLFKSSADVLKKAFNVEMITAENIQGMSTTDAEVSKALDFIKKFVTASGYDEAKMNEGYDYFSNQIKYSLNLDFDPRNIVGDNYSDNSERYYGNNQVVGPDAKHGTHVAGIIAATRNNSIGMDGVADNVKIMVIRTVPNGDERDKDVANSIRYAVDNGAKVINMSFGKNYSPQKEIVDAAVQYAEERGVLLVHAAGNDSKDVDVENNFPSKKHLNGQMPDNWIEVGALSWGKDGNQVAVFSNYGKENVDLFAPGDELNSTVPDQKYAKLSGTSMAAPVVSGVAALLFSYFPKLDYKQVRDILLESVVSFKGKQVNKPGSESKVSFEQLCKTAGEVNALKALQMAAKMAK